LKFNGSGVHAQKTSCAENVNNDVIYANMRTRANGHILGI